MSVLIKNIMAGLILAVLAMNGVAESVGTSKASGAVEQIQAVNINTADAQTIATNLKGVGLKKAEAIVAYRKLHGEFKSLEELTDVKGIGVATLEKNVSNISF